MKIGRKGFMLAEVVVVAVVVATVLVTLFTGLNNVSSAYETRNRYYDVDSLFAAMEVNDILVRSFGTADFGRIKDYLTDSGAMRVYEFAQTTNEIDAGDIQDFGEFYYSINRGSLQEDGDNIISYITPYDLDEMLSLASFDDKTSNTFDEYLNYLSGNLDFTADYDYMIIVERRENNNIDDCYYYALKLKY